MTNVAHYVTPNHIMWTEFDDKAELVATLITSGTITTLAGLDLDSADQFVHVSWLFI